MLRQRIIGGLCALALGILFSIYAFLAWEGTANQPAKPNAAHQSQNTSQQHVEEGTGWHWLTHDAAGFFTLWLVVVGLGQAGVFIWQLLLIRGQLGLMREGLADAKEAADAAKELADVAGKAVALAELTAKRQLRAHIFIDDIIIDFKNFSYDPNIRIIVKNFGETPGKNIRNTFDVRPIFAAFSKDEQQFDLTTCIPGQLADLAPAHVFGVVHYTDIFEDLQSTHYRYRLLVDSTGIPKGKAHLIMEGHAGNRAT